MDNSLFSIFNGKYFNQNLICFILSYLGVFFANYYNICCLDYFCYGLLLASICSLFVTIGVYTWEYLQRKAYKASSNQETRNAAYNTKSQEYYKILECDSNISDEELKKQYKKLMIS